MAYYRLYFLDRFDGHIKRFHEFEAVDDEAAISACEEWRGFQAAELWSRHRKVKQWEAVTPSPPIGKA